MWQEKDITVSSTISETPTTATSTTAASIKIPNNNKLSTTGAIGIGVGSALGAVALLSLGVLIWILRRKKATHLQNNVNGLVEAQSTVVTEVEGMSKVPELFTEPIPHYGPHELAGQSYELPESGT